MRYSLVSSKKPACVSAPAQTHMKLRPACSGERSCLLQSMVGARPIAARGGASGDGSGLRVFRLFLAGSVSATSLSVHVCRTARRAGWDGHSQAKTQGEEDSDCGSF